MSPSIKVAGMAGGEWKLREGARPSACLLHSHVHPARDRPPADMLARAAVVYDRLNATRPLCTKAVTSATLLGAGDVLCQCLDGTRAAAEELDVCRVLRMTSWGLVVNGPTGHLWYKGLDSVVRASGARGVATKVAADQLIYTPPLTFGYFLWQNLLQGDSPLAASSAAACQVMPTLQVNWLYWSAVHVATFSLIRVEYRVAFVSVKNFLWGGFLSWIATQRGSSQEGVARDDIHHRIIPHEVAAAGNSSRLTRRLSHA